MTVSMLGMENILLDAAGNGALNEALSYSHETGITLPSFSEVVSGYRRVASVADLVPGSFVIDDPNYDSDGRNFLIKPETADIARLQGMIPYEGLTFDHNDAGLVRIQKDPDNYFEFHFYEFGIPFGSSDGIYRAYRRRIADYSKGTVAVGDMCSLLNQNLIGTFIFPPLYQLKYYDTDYPAFYVCGIFDGVINAEVSYGVRINGIDYRGLHQSFAASAPNRSPVSFPITGSLEHLPKGTPELLVILVSFWGTGTVYSLWAGAPLLLPRQWQEGGAVAGQRQYTVVSSREGGSFGGIVHRPRPGVLNAVMPDVPNEWIQDNWYDARNWMSRRPFWHFLLDDREYAPDLWGIPPSPLSRRYGYRISNRMRRTNSTYAWCDQPPPPVELSATGYSTIRLEGKTYPDYKFLDD